MKKVLVTSKFQNEVYGAKMGVRFSPKVIDSDPPSVPTGLIATPISTSQVDLSWNASTDNTEVLGYEIWRNDLFVTMTAGLTFSDTGRIASTTYQYQVLAYDAAGNKSALCAKVPATTLAVDTTLPMPITWANAATFSVSQVDLVWEASTDNIGVTNYAIYMDGSLLTTIGNLLSYRVEGLIAETTHTFYIRAKDAAGNLGGPSPTVTAKTSIFNVMSYGAVGNGIADDTAAIQSAITAAGSNYSAVLVPDGTYMIDALVKLLLINNMTFRMTSGAILRAIPNSSTHSGIIRIITKTNVNVIGGTVQGERAGHIGTTGEWGNGVEIYAGTSIMVNGVTSKDCWGDGFYVDDNSVNVRFLSVIADNNRRQGLSIVSADDVLIEKSIFKNTNGTAPEYGIDIEPDTGKTVSNVTIIKSEFFNNIKGGIDVNGMSGIITNIIIDGNTITENGVFDVNGAKGILLNLTSGHTVINNIISNNLQKGLELGASANNIISGNTINNNGSLDSWDNGYGIYIQYPQSINNTITMNTITGNIIDDIKDTIGGNTISGNIVSATRIVPNIIGMTSANANTALSSVNLIFGIITGSSGVVISQTPVSGTVIGKGESVAYTIA